MECKLLHFISRELSNQIKFHTLCRFQSSYSGNGSWMFTALREPSCDHNALVYYAGFSFNKVELLLLQFQLILTTQILIKVIKINIRDDSITWNICYGNFNHYSSRFKSRVMHEQLRVAEVFKFFALNGARIIPVICVYFPKPYFIEMLMVV